MHTVCVYIYRKLYNYDRVAHIRTRAYYNSVLLLYDVYSYASNYNCLSIRRRKNRFSYYIALYRGVRKKFSKKGSDGFKFD